MSEIQTYKFYAGNRLHEPSSEKYFESEDPSIGKVWAKHRKSIAKSMGTEKGKHR